MENHAAKAEVEMPKGLYDNKGIVAAHAVIKPVSVNDFALPHQGSAAQYFFSLSKESLAEGLRKLIADVEAGRLLPQKVRVQQTAEVTDFAMMDVILTFALVHKVVSQEVGHEL